MGTASIAVATVVLCDLSQAALRGWLWSLNQRLFTPAV